MNLSNKHSHVGARNCNVLLAKTQHIISKNVDDIKLHPSLVFLRVSWNIFWQTNDSYI